MTFPPTVIQEIKDRISIVGYIGEHIPLKKAGRNHKGLCPFHQEKTPSFHVHDDRQIFHCFGCSEGGDLIHFVMKHQGLSFPEAVRELAARAGVELPAVGPSHEAGLQAKQHRQRLLRVNELASEYFVANLSQPQRGQAARNYLQSRGFSNREFFEQHLVGHADEQWEGLSQFLRSRQVPLEYAVELGLIKKRPQADGHFDFFRDRIMFPIRDRHGAVIAFGGRIVPSEEKTDESAKYLNSPESPLFQKSTTLYGLPLSAEGMRQRDRAIIVEGYLDVLALQQVGLTETVAPLGTALTEDHLRMIMRYTHNCYCCFDGDAAGRRAARRVLPLALALGVIPHVIVLPEGSDPDLIVQQGGAAAFEERIGGAITLFEWIIDETVALAGADTVGRVKSVETLRPFFAALHDPIQRGSYRDRLSRALHIDPQLVERALTEGGKVVTPQRTKTPSHTAPTGSADDREVRGRAKAEEHCLAFLLQVPEGMANLASQLAPEDFQVAVHRAIAERCWELYDAEGAVVVSHLLGSTEDALFHSTVSRLTLAGERYDQVEGLGAESSKILVAMHRVKWQEQRSAINEAIAMAERRGALDEVDQLISEKARLERQWQVALQESQHDA
jgi:DNA primase